MRRSALASIVIVTFVVGLGIGSVSFPISTTTTTTKTLTAASGATGTTRLLELQFVQQPACSSFWLAPWEVVLSNLTTVQPSNATLPLNESHFTAGANDEKYSTITFSVPNGSYNYTVYPQSFLRQTGIVTIDDSDIVIQVHAAPVHCTTSAG